MTTIAAARRQKWIDQSQSVNLFLATATKWKKAYETAKKANKLKFSE